MNNNKRWFTAFLVLLMALLCTACSSNKPSIVGEWEFINIEGTKRTNIYDASGDMKMTSSNPVIHNALNYTPSKYVFDDSKDPAWLDIVQKENGKIQARFIVKFIDNDTMQLKSSGKPESARPEGFTVGDNSFVMHRVKPR